ncbi:MAG: hypothetical protein WB460_15060 [Candidatus Acidiferrales bacterium]
MDNGKIAPETSAGQEAPPQGVEIAVLDQLVQDIRVIRQRSFSKNPKSRTGVVAGQVLLLLIEAQKGKRLPRRSLHGFFRFISRDRDTDRFFEAA